MDGWNAGFSIGEDGQRGRGKDSFRLYRVAQFDHVAEMTPRGGRMDAERRGRVTVPRRAACEHTGNKKSGHKRQDVQSCPDWRQSIILSRR